METQKFDFFQESSKLNFDLYFNLCQRAEIIQVGLNMNLYDDIGDASSSLWGSTSSLIFFVLYRIFVQLPYFFTQVIHYFIAYYQAKRHYSSAAKLAMKAFEDKLSKENYVKFITTMRLLDYHFIVHDMCRAYPLRFPEAFAPLWSSHKYRQL